MELFIAIVNMLAFVILAFYAWASYELQRATRASTETERDKLEQFQERYETRLAPDLAARLELRGGEIPVVALHLQNVGNTDARCVQLHLDPPLETTTSHDRTLEDGNDRLASGDAFDLLLGTIEAWGETETPTRLACHLHWEDDEARAYDKTVELDVSAATTLASSVEPGLERTDELADRVDEIEARLETLRGDLD